MNQKEERDLANANEIKQLFESPIFVEGFERLERLLVDKMIHSPLDKRSVREEARYQLEALRSIKGELKHVLETGKLILKSEEERQEREAFFDDEP